MGTAAEKVWLWGGEWCTLNLGLNVTAVQCDTGRHSTMQWAGLQMQCGYEGGGGQVAPAV